MYANAPHGLVLLLLCVTLAAVAVSDVRSRKIPNALVLLIATEGFVHAAATGGLRGLLASVLGACAGVALVQWQYRRGLLGAGDVKLLGALGAWGGVLGALTIFIVGSALGGVLAVVSFLRLAPAERQEVGQSLASLASGKQPSVAVTELPRARGIPYGVALAIAGGLVLAWGARA